MTEIDSVGESVAGVMPPADSGYTPESGAPASPSAPSVETAERMVPQSTVNKLVGRTKQEAYERAQRELQQQYGAQGTRQDVGGMPAMTQEQFDQMMSNYHLKQQDRQAAQDAQTVAAEFMKRLETRKDAYSDFGATIAKLNVGGSPEVAQLVPFVNKLENTADVMYELGKQPQKLAQILTLMRVSPELANDQLTDLSRSIANNQAATANQKIPNEPLSQIQPSIHGADNGARTVRDYKADPRFRG